MFVKGKDDACSRLLPPSLFQKLAMSLHVLVF